VRPCAEERADDEVGAEASVRRILQGIPHVQKLRIKLAVEH
jgi:hypothetical protein